MSQVVAIRHVAFEDLGLFGEVLADRGDRVRYIEAADAKLQDLDPRAADLLVVLGGPIGAYEEDAYPFLTQELKLLEQRLQADLPTLGICLGAQLMARALGASVYPGGRKEIGWAPVRLTEEGLASPLRQFAPDTAVLHWHGDTFDLPEGATRLASTDLYENQAFRWAGNALALQFHAEATASGLEHWFVGHASEISATSGLSVAQLRRQTDVHARRVHREGRQFFEQWLEQVLPA